MYVFSSVSPQQTLQTVADPLAVTASVAVVHDQPDTNAGVPA